MNWKLEDYLDKELENWKYDAERSTVKAQYNKPLRFNSDKAINTFHLINFIVKCIKGDPPQNERYSRLLVISLHPMYLKNEVLHVSLAAC